MPVGSHLFCSVLDLSGKFWQNPFSHFWDLCTYANLQAACNVVIRITPVPPNQIWRFSTNFIYCLEPKFFWSVELVLNNRINFSFKVSFGWETAQTFAFADEICNGTVESFLRKSLRFGLAAVFIQIHRSKICLIMVNDVQVKSCILMKIGIYSSGFQTEMR